MDQSITPMGLIADGVARAPIPDWVDLTPYERPAQADPHFVHDGLSYLLDDTQVDLTGPERAWFFRRADLVAAHRGAERAAAFEAVFDPTYDRLELHSIRVLRGDQVIEHVNSKQFEVMRRERSLEQMKFDGRLSVHLIIPDVRVGDIVETCFTHYGMREVLQNKHVAWIGFEWAQAMVETRHRLRAPTGREVSMLRVNNPPEASVTEADGIIDRRWRAFKRPPIKFEPLAPPQTLQRAEIEFSEWRDWAEVAAAFTPGYEQAAELPDEIAQEIARIESVMSQPEDRAVAALVFVQNSIRYLAIAIGNGGFVPRSLADIWETRYGDCKDKSKLFVHIARRLGLDACPALVNTREGEGLAAQLPSGIAFDHCIVRLKIGAKTYWLDPTAFAQESRLDQIGQSYLGWALPLTPDADSLVDMGEAPAIESLSSLERVTLGESPQTPIRYEWRITHRGWRAEAMRERIAREGEVGLFKNYADAVQRHWPKAKPVKQQILTDDRGQNVLTTLEEYEVEDAWTKTEDNQYRFASFDVIMNGVLPGLDPGERKYPIYLGRRGQYRRTLEIVTARDWNAAAFDKSVASPAVDVRTALRQVSPTLMELRQSLDIKLQQAAPEDAGIYRDVVAELSNSDIFLNSRVDKKGKFVSALKEGESSDWLSVAGWIILGVVAINVARLLFGG